MQPEATQTGDGLATTGRSMIIDIGVWTRLIKPTRRWPTLVFVVAALAAAPLAFPSWSAACLFLSVVVGIAGLAKADPAPVENPARADGDRVPRPPCKPGVKPPASATGGACYLGFDRRDGKEVWLSPEDSSQKFLVVGRTGSGRTDFLIGFGANALASSSGFLLIDGSGDASLSAKVVALARRFGRGDDVLFLNGEKPPSGEKAANTLNPFAKGNAYELARVLVNLLEDEGDDGAMWKGKAATLLNGLLPALVELRDQGGVALDAAVVRGRLPLQRLLDLADATNHPTVSAGARRAVLSYLTSLPGYDPKAGAEQNPFALERHARLAGALSRALGVLIDDFGHLFSGDGGEEVDLVDVFVNRRILVVALPAPDSPNAACVGKVVASLLQDMMSRISEDRVPGHKFGPCRDRINASSPFFVIMDEVDSYCVDRIDLLASSAPHLGFSTVYAVGDLDRLRKSHPFVLGAIAEGSTTRLVMRFESPEPATPVVEVAVKVNEVVAAESVRGDDFRVTVRVDGDPETRRQAMELAAAAGALDGEGGSQAPRRPSSGKLEARVAEVERVKFLDLDTAGQLAPVRVVYKDEIIRACGFYANPEGALDTNRPRPDLRGLGPLPTPTAGEAP